MRKRIVFTISCCLTVLSVLLQSCDLDNNEMVDGMMPIAVVTVCPQEDESVLLRQDDVTVLRPVNMTASTFGGKEVRALVNYTPVEEKTTGGIIDVKINSIDTIRTKMPLTVLPGTDVTTYGNDPIEIMGSWVTVAEDGYLTLMVRTVRNPLFGSKHTLNLLAGTNPENPLEFVLCHDANGDYSGDKGDSLIAFNLNDIVGSGESDVKIKIVWNSFTGYKTTEFNMSRRKE